MHPLDTDDRIPELKKEFGSGMCNITRCCTEVCPEHIGITDNGIIPLKERVVDRYYDPVAIIGRKLFGIRKRTEARSRGAGQDVRPVTMSELRRSSEVVARRDPARAREGRALPPAQRSRAGESIYRDVLAVDSGQPGRAARR